MAQTYTDPVAIARLRAGDCPECGGMTAQHGGWGRPGCSLTDNGVADRIEHQRRIDEGRCLDCGWESGHWPYCKQATLADADNITDPQARARRRQSIRAAQRAADQRDTARKP